MLYTYYEWKKKLSWTKRKEDSYKDKLIEDGKGMGNYKVDKKKWEFMISSISIL